MARQPESRYDYAPLIQTALATGLRIGELLGLQWQDIDFEQGELHVRRQWRRSGQYGPVKTKAGNRRIPLEQGFVSYLRELKMRSPYSQPEHPVFATRKTKKGDNGGKPLQHRNVTSRGFELAAEKAGIEGVSIHDTRHAFASRLIDRGISATVLAKLMGHETSAVTERVYVHRFDRVRSDDAVREAMAR